MANGTGSNPGPFILYYDGFFATAPTSANLFEALLFSRLSGWFMTPLVPCRISFHLSIVIVSPCFDCIY